MGVYFIQSGEDGPIKVGKADDVTARQRGLQTGNPCELIVRAWQPTWGRAHERTLHVRLADHRIHLEWFHPVDLVLQAADECRQGRWVEHKTRSGILPDGWLATHARYGLFAIPHDAIAGVMSLTELREACGFSRQFLARHLKVSVVELVAAENGLPIKRWTYRQLRDYLGPAYMTIFGLNTLALAPAS